LAAARPLRRPPLLSHCAFISVEEKFGMRFKNVIILFLLIFKKISWPWSCVCWGVAVHKTDRSPVMRFVAAGWFYSWRTP